MILIHTPRIMEKLDYITPHQEKILRYSSHQDFFTEMSTGAYCSEGFQSKLGYSDGREQ